MCLLAERRRSRTSGTAPSSAYGALRTSSKASQRMASTSDPYFNDNVTSYSEIEFEALAAAPVYSREEDHVPA